MAASTKLKYVKSAKTEWTRIVKENEGNTVENMDDVAFLKAAIEKFYWPEPNQDKWNSNHISRFEVKRHEERGVYCIHALFFDNRSTTYGKKWLKSSKGTAEKAWVEVKFREVSSPQIESFRETSNAPVGYEVDHKIPFAVAKQAFLEMEKVKILPYEQKVTEFGNFHEIVYVAGKNLQMLSKEDHAKKTESDRGKTDQYKRDIAKFVTVYEERF